MNKLHPGVKWLFRLRSYSALLFIFIFLGAFGLSFYLAMSGSGAILYWLIPSYILLIILISEIYAQMAYSRWVYEFTDSGLRLERGIIWKRYSNVPYERIQNVDIHRGIIARMFNFSSILIQTAGYSAAAYSEGYIPGIDTQEAERIRSFVMKKITGRKHE